MAQGEGGGDPKAETDDRQLCGGNLEVLFSTGSMKNGALEIKVSYATEK